MNKITEKGECVQNCTSTNYKYEYNFKCISNCLSGIYINNYNVKNVMKIAKSAQVQKQ